VEKKLKINLHQNEKIISIEVTDKERDSLILNKKIGDSVFFRNVNYLLTGATSSNGSFHFKDSELRGKAFIGKRTKKLMVESKYLDQKTNQIFLSPVLQEIS